MECLNNQKTKQNKKQYFCNQWHLDLVKNIPVIINKWIFGIIIRGIKLLSKKYLIIQTKKIRTMSKIHIQSCSS